MSLPLTQPDQNSSKTPNSDGSNSQNQQKPNPEELNDQRSRWLSRLFNENPQLLAYRERTLPWTGGYSFSNVVHSDSTAALYHVNRHKVLELIYQHLSAIGMYQTAEILKEECGHNFQQTEQSWDKTDLLILISLGILPREDPWKIVPDPHHKCVEEEIEEDFFSSQYVENPKNIDKELMDPNYKVVFKDGLEKGHEISFHTIKLASLRRLILVAISTTLDDDLNRFFLSLHLVTSLHHFLDHLIYLFDFEPPPNSKTSFNREAVRRDIVNLIKKWVNYHGKFIGKNTIKSISRFQLRIISDPNCSKFYVFANSILQAIKKINLSRSSQMEKPKETPVIPNAQIIFQPNLKITDPSPIEAARQISLLFHNAFKAVYSREFIIAARDQQVSHQTPTLADFSEFGKKFTLLILELIINICLPPNYFDSSSSGFLTPNLSSSSVEKVIISLLDIGESLAQLRNFEALACIIRALRCKEILSLPVMQVPANKDKLEILYKKSGEDKSSFQAYLSEVNKYFYSWNPTIPNIRAELKIDLLSYYSSTDSASCLFGPYLRALNSDDKSSTKPSNISSKSSQSSFIDGLINWEQIWSNSERTSIFYRFQHQLSYNFYTIPQIKNVIERGPTINEYQAIENLGRIKMKPQSK